MAIPTLSETLNTAFVETWYEIRAQAIDNILDSTIFSMALKEFGSMTPEVGARFITRTVRYGEKSLQNIAKGSILDQNEVEIDTLARWTWKYNAVDVNQSIIDSQINSGPSKIKDYVANRLGVARDAIVQDTEQNLLRSAGEDSSGKQHNGLYDIIAPKSASVNNLSDAHSITPEAGESAGASEKNGNIARTQAYWQNIYYTGALSSGSAANASAGNYALNLVPVMRNLFNKTTAQLEAPNFILMNRDLFEAYEDEVADKQQIVRTSFDQKAADLGFETFTFKGATCAWASDLDADASTPVRDMFMINMDYVEWVFDPNLWFDMTGWKGNTNQLEEVAYIVSAQQLITAQPRRHGFVTFIS
jgi:hypothetical protein